MKAMKLDPESDRCELIEISSGLAGLQNAVGGYIEVIPVDYIPRLLDLLCVAILYDEEAVLKGKPDTITVASRRTGAIARIRGTVLFCAVEGNEFSDLSQIQIDAVRQLYDGRAQM